MKLFNILPFLKAVTALCLITAATTGSQAQLNPLSGMYYQNQYMANPAMAGLNKELNIGLGYRQQWSSMPGAPTTQSLTGDYGFSNKVGIGLNLYNDKAGLKTSTRVMGTYAYHLPLDVENKKINFGLSLGFMAERLADEDIRGNPNDVSIGQVNERETFIDGDFGIAYTSNKLTVQGAIPNLKNYLKKDHNRNTVDQATFFSAISYKLYLPAVLDGMGIEPKAVYRGVRGHDNMLDIGTNLTLVDESVTLMGMYHSTKSATFGMGVNYKRSVSILGMYTTETSALSSYVNGNFEIGIRIKLD